MHLLPFFSVASFVNFVQLTDNSYKVCLQTSALVRTGHYSQYLVKRI